MARRRKKTKLADLAPQPDPQAPLDSQAFLQAATPVLDLLTKDLLARADGSAGITRALKARHAFEKSKQLTADKYEVWRRHVVVQIAAAWLLSCVFVRTLEDRGLLAHNRIAGPGAKDAEHLFCMQLAPYLTERDYLRAVFTELGHLPATKELFDREHNLVWRLAPSAEATKELLGLFRTPDPAAPAFRFGQASTRFLGDLYQDVSEDVRKRFALLQTPDFIETFILDRTLEPAVEEFGLADTTVIDPTCGSGHFVLGAFERLFDKWCAAEPGGSVESAVEKALAGVYGVDVNPYAVAIAKFRLTLVALEKLGVRELGKAPGLGCNVVVADSLLHNYSKGQKDFGDLEEQAAEVWKSPAFALEDERAAKEILRRSFSVVVGNPPYITVKDKALRDAYRAIYTAAFRQYSLATPFMERFFELGRSGAFVGQITANSFMKREFGKKLIEQVLPGIDLTLIVNTAGAYIPGHGTPTVLVFGRSRAPVDAQVHAVLARRGEPRTPEDPAEGEVWSSIRDRWSEDGFENEYITVDRVDREKLRKHPWSLEGGGAAELKALLEERAAGTLGALAEAIGFGVVTREDDLFLVGEGCLERHRIPEAQRRPLVAGEDVRDWAIQGATLALWPYDPDSLESLSEGEARDAVVRFLWPYRTLLSGRVAYGKTQTERGLPWFEYSMFFSDRFRTQWRITFAEVATHNHFVLDRGGKVFKQTAPIIKLPDSATEDDHLALLAYLNSSTACFYLRHVATRKQMMGAEGIRHTDPTTVTFAFNAGSVSKIPIPSWTPDQRIRAANLARKLLEDADRLAAQAPERLISFEGASVSIRGTPRDAQQVYEQALRRMVAAQEEIDWLVYSSFGLADVKTEGATQKGVAPGCRPFEALLHESGVSETINGHQTCPSSSLDSLGLRRLDLIRSNAMLRLIECTEFKRRWIGRQGRFNRLVAADEDLWRDAASEAIASVLEHYFGQQSVPELLSDSDAALSRALAAKVEGLGPSIPGQTAVREILRSNAVPYLRAHFLTDSGLEKYVVWQRTWTEQAREDAGESDSGGDVPVPPKYDQKDFLSPTYWPLRGKLDVPKERFISYPGCESDQDNEPVYGWAGWDHAQRARALAALYVARKDEEAWSKDRLQPMLAGLLELLPWLKQWHNEVDPDYGQGLGDFFDHWLSEECREHNLTFEDLRAWRAESAVRSRRGGDEQRRTSASKAVSGGSQGGRR